MTNVGDRVFFDLDAVNLTSESRRQLDAWIRFLKKYPDDKLTLEGHTDERSTREYNLALGAARAEAVKDYLIAHGIDTSRLKTVSYGKEKPEALGHDEASWAQNRRVVGIISQD